MIEGDLESLWTCHPELFVVINLITIVSIFQVFDARLTEPIDSHNVSTQIQNRANIADGI